VSHNTSQIENNHELGSTILVDGILNHQTILLKGCIIHVMTRVAAVSYNEIFFVTKNKNYKISRELDYSFRITRTVLLEKNIIRNV